MYVLVERPRLQPFEFGLFGLLVNIEMVIAVHVGTVGSRSGDYSECAINGVCTSNTCYG